MNHSLITAYPGLKSVAPRYWQGEEGSSAAMGWRNPLHPTADPPQPPSFTLARGAGAPEPQGSCAEEGAVGQGDGGLDAPAGSVSAWHVASAAWRGAGGRARICRVKGVEQKP